MVGIKNLSWRSSVLPEQALALANSHLANSKVATDRELALEHCYDAAKALSRMKRSARRALSISQNSADLDLRDRIASAYQQHGDRMENLALPVLAQESYRKSKKWRSLNPAQPERNTDNDLNDSTADIHDAPSEMTSETNDSINNPNTNTNGANNAPKPRSYDPATGPHGYFRQDLAPGLVRTVLPEPDERLLNTPQLVHCLSLLNPDSAAFKAATKEEIEWSRATLQNFDEQERLRNLVTDLILAFMDDGIKAEATVAEVVYLAPVLDEDQYRRLLATFIDQIDGSVLLEIHLVEGLAQLMQLSPPGYLASDDLIRILNVLNKRLSETDSASDGHIYKLTITVSHVLDAMVNNNVKGLSREDLHQPLSGYLKSLQRHSDPYMVYHAAYAYQALQYVPDDETPLQATLRRTTAVTRGVFGLVSAVKAMDVNGFMEGLTSIQDGLLSMGEMCDLAMNMYEKVGGMASSGGEFQACLSEAFSFSKKSAWYPALRGVDQLLETGQLSHFRRLVCESACRLDPAFQWGICQRLGELASNHHWEMDARHGAVAFLGEIYKNDVEWGSHAHIKQWVLTILMPLGAQGEKSLRSAEILVRDLESHGEPSKRAIYQGCLREPQTQYPLKVDLPPVSSTTLLDKVQNIPDVETGIRQLRKLRFKERDVSPFFVPLQAKPSLDAGDNTKFDIMERTMQFLEGDQKVLLILGDSGAGKSTFTRALEYRLWDAYQKGFGSIPLHINLAAIKRPDRDMIAKQLRDVGFSDAEIKELKDQRNFILICDGYDESQQSKNLYYSNKLNEFNEWKAQMIISCRTEYLNADYRDRFQPMDRYKKPEPSLLLEAVVLPFSKSQIQEFISYYVNSKSPLWKEKDYQQTLQQIPSLNELVSNPFLLELALDVLPQIVDPSKPMAASKVTRMALYDQFVEQWIERGKIRLGETVKGEAKRVFEYLSEEGFVQRGMIFLKALAVSIYEKNGGNPVVEYSSTVDQNTWKEAFFGREVEKQLLRDASPLKRSGNQYRFIHRSILEYAFARAVFEPQNSSTKGAKTEDMDAARHSRSRRSSISSILSFETPLDGDDGSAKTKKSKTGDEEPDDSSPLVVKNFVGEPSLMHFLVERVQGEAIFKDQLLSYIEHSKKDKKWRIAAANAITILVRAQVLSFSGEDLRGVRIPGADVSHGVFDSTQFQGADLRKVNFRNCYLGNAELADSNMQGALFGEWPYLEAKAEVHACAYSPDGKNLIAGTDTGAVKIFKTQSSELVRELEGHTDWVRGIRYSPTDKQFASFSDDRTVIVWNAESFKKLHTFTGHNESVFDLEYFPNGSCIVSSSYDGMVRIWDSQSFQPIQEFEGHPVFLRCTAVSPDNKLIATCGHDNIIRLWDVEQNRFVEMLDGHKSAVYKVVFSPNAERLASGGKDGTVRVWSALTLEQRDLEGHSDSIVHLVYSSNGRYLASGSLDNTVRLWDARSGSNLHILGGHRDSVSGLTFSPDSEQIVTYDGEQTVRVWDTKTGQMIHIFAGQTDDIHTVIYSPSGHQIASASEDETVRLWATQSPVSGQTPHGHTSDIITVVFSPDGKVAVSGSSDNTIRVWETVTGKVLHVFEGHSQKVSKLKISVDGERIASSSWESIARLYNVQEGEQCFSLENQTGNNHTWDLTLDCKMIAYSAEDSVVCIHDIESDELVYNLVGHKDTVIGAVFSPDGQQLASGSYDKEIRLWDLTTGQSSFVLAGHDDYITLLVYSNDGRYLASSSYDKTVRLWDTKTGKEIHSLPHDMLASSVAFSPSQQATRSNGKAISGQIATGTYGNSVTLWDHETGTKTHTLDGHSDAVEVVAYSPNGGLIASGSRDNMVFLWGTKSGECLAKLDNFRNDVPTLAWAVCAKDSEAAYLVTGDHNSAVQMWYVVGYEGHPGSFDDRMEQLSLEQERSQQQCSACLVWNSHQLMLTAVNAKLQSADGMNRSNAHLLKQRGATGEPVAPLDLFQTSKRLSGAQLAVSKFKQLIANKAQEPVGPSSAFSFKTTATNKGPLEIPMSPPSSISSSASTQTLVGSGASSPLASPPLPGSDPVHSVEDTNLREIVCNKCCNSQMISWRYHVRLE